MLSWDDYNDHQTNTAIAPAIGKTEPQPAPGSPSNPRQADSPEPVADQLSARQGSAKQVQQEMPARASNENVALTKPEMENPKSESTQLDKPSDAVEDYRSSLK